MKKIFISYSDYDKAKMIALKKAIERDGIHIVPIVIADQKKPLESLTDKVCLGINDCDILVPILTSNSINNQWVNQEIGYAKAKEKKILPIISKGVFKDLKGFIHSQVDCPFQFKDNTSVKMESAAFRAVCKGLIDHVIIYSVQPNETTVLSSNISPSRVQRGAVYTTNVHFKGTLKNGFFDNYVQHLSSSFVRWNVDKETLPITKGTDPGTLHGSIDLTKKYSHSTKDWPIGKYKIHVRVYDHPTPGETGRIIVDENIHEIEIV